jgi:AraC-like DNA-binding protein
MSARTLARRLGGKDAGFASILRGLREDLARRYLADPGIGLGEVAFLVGYADVSAFSHAFKRWTGTQPGALRRAA